MHANGGTGDPRAPCDKANARATRQIGICGSGKGCTTFLPHGDEAQHVALIVDRIQGRQITFARDTKDYLSPVDLERIHQNLTARSHRSHTDILASCVSTAGPSTRSTERRMLLISMVKPRAVERSGFGNPNAGLCPKVAPWASEQT